MFQPSINTVSEFKVDNSTFSAEYGRNSGAIVNVATRSGANRLHGEAFDYYRDDRFDSRNFFNPPTIDAAGNEAPKSPFNRKQFGFNLGGPIVKNRAFYFFSYEGLRHTQGVDLNSGTLTPAQRAAVTDRLAGIVAVHPHGERPNGTRTIVLRRPVESTSTTIVRATLGKRRHSFLLSVPKIRARVESSGPNRAGSDGAAANGRDTLNETHVFSPALVNEVRAGFNRINITFVPQTLVDTTALGINVGQTSMPIPLPAITISGPGLNFGGPGGFPSGREVTTFALGDTATYLHGTTS